MTNEELRRLLQDTYFANVDSAQASAAVQAFTPDVRWQHTQVWAHDGHDSRYTDRIEERDALSDFMHARVKEMQLVRIRHQVDETIVSGERGAFRARVIGPEGDSLGFVGWVELKDNLVSRYIVMPENYSSAE